VGFRGVFFCHLVIAGLMVDGGEVMTLGGRQVVLGRGQVVLRGWMLNGHVGPPVALPSGSQGSLADRLAKAADLTSR
jgi:hypothetical protein